MHTVAASNYIQCTCVYIWSVFPKNLLRPIRQGDKKYSIYIQRTHMQARDGEKLQRRAGVCDGSTEFSRARITPRGSRRLGSCLLGRFFFSRAADDLSRVGKPRGNQ